MLHLVRSEKSRQLKSLCVLEEAVKASMILHGDQLRLCHCTSDCKADENLIKVPLIVDGGHLAAVLCRVGPGGVEDQDVGRLSELSSVLQVPFTEREEKTSQSPIHTARPEKQELRAKFSPLFTRPGFES